MMSFESSEEECYSAMDEEILRERLFISSSRGTPLKDTKPSKEELCLQSKWVVDEMGVGQNFAAVKDRSWVWQMYCLLSEERRRLTTYKQYEIFMLGVLIQKARERCSRKRASGASSKDC